MSHYPWILAVLLAASCGGEQRDPAESEPRGVPAEVAPAPRSIPASDAETEVDMPDASPSLPHAQLPKQVATPRSIADTEWEHLHWLPPTVTGMTRYGENQAPIVEWLGKQLVGTPPACNGVLTGIRRVISVEVPGNAKQQAQLFIGAIDRATIEGCLTAMAPDFDGSIRSEGEITVLQSGGAPASHIGWARLHDGAVVAILYDDRVLIESWLVTQSDALAGNQALIAMMRRIDEAQGVWMATTRPYGQNQLGVPTAGMYFTLNSMDLGERETPMRLAGGVLLASKADAVRARKAANKFAKMVKAKVGLDLQPDVDPAGFVTFSASFTWGSVAKAGLDSGLWAEFGVEPKAVSPR